ncbi:unnamed protein product [Moneuplotes crassus]|uniref:Uncharacterized protein n=1 Tax=Euplotes crassus TaxID=5936 RepID=A0AAD1Y822_EUPCR|nr:unnamed protein product [Moneuplotes crassus]
MEPSKEIRGIAHRKRTGDDYRFMVSSPTQNIKRPKLKHSNTKAFRHGGQDTLTKDLLSPNCTSPANFSKNSDYKRSNCKNLDEISSPNSSISNENKNIFTTKQQGFEPQILSL